MAAVTSTPDRPADKPPVDRVLYNYVFRSMKRAHDMFANDKEEYADGSNKAVNLYRAYKTKNDYGNVINAAKETKRKRTEQELNLPNTQRAGIQAVVDREHQQLAITSGSASATAVSNPSISKDAPADGSVRSLLPSKANLLVKPTWHAPWKLYRVISGHTGWVRSIDVEPNNEWFATAGADRIIKASNISALLCDAKFNIKSVRTTDDQHLQIWDLASGKLKLSLTGHISTVRAVKLSTRHPYLFSVGEDKQVKCWDLEQNKVVRHYHGHLSAVQDIALHPLLDLIVTTGRDATARVWDMRTKAQVFCLTGHTNTVASVVCQENDPQVITGSHDTTIRLWDLAAGRSVCTLTNHKKSVRSLVLHPHLGMFASGSTDNIKQWQSREGIFYQNLSGHNSMINALAINEDGVLVSGGDNGTMCFWDWNSGFCFQKEHPPPQPGSIDSESGIFAMTFDRSGTRLLTAEADKSIKMWKEDPEATEDTHPIVWRPEMLRRQKT